MKIAQQEIDTARLKFFRDFDTAERRRIFVMLNIIPADSTDTLFDVTERDFFDRFLAKAVRGPNVDGRTLPVWAEPAPRPLEQRCIDIADQVVPEYRTQGRYHACGSHTAQRWQTAWDGACSALGGDPAEYRR